MKKSIITAVAIAFILFSCSTGKNTIQSFDNATITSNCTENYDCTFEAQKDKSLVVKTDDTGHNYFNVIDTPGKTVLKYSYKRITDPRIQDAGYVETITFEIDNNTAALNLKGKDIQKTKMVLNIACFCKGKAGVRKIEEGILTFKDNKLHIEIPELVEGQVTRVVDVEIR